MSAVVVDEAPKIVLRDPPQALGERVVLSLARLDLVGALVALLSDSGEAARAGLRSLLRSLIDEGQRYAGTAPGKRWAAVLQNTSAVHNGWLLWNHANLDFYVRNAEPLRDSPAELLRVALGALAQADTAELLTTLSTLSAELDAGLRAPDAART